MTEARRRWNRHIHCPTPGCTGMVGTPFAPIHRPLEVVCDGYWQHTFTIQDAARWLTDNKKGRPPTR